MHSRPHRVIEASGCESPRKMSAVNEKILIIEDEET